MDYQIKQVGAHRGKPRLYFQTRLLAKAGLAPASRYKIEPHPTAPTLVLRHDPAGDRVVSSKDLNGRRVPIIDINSARDLAAFDGMQAVKVTFCDGEIRISPLASELSARDRLRRLKKKIHGGLSMSGVAFGGGILDHAVHTGMAEAGLPVETVMVNEIDADLVEHAVEANPVITYRTSLLAAPMQELVQDDEAMASIQRSEFLVAGIPCSGASKSGKSKNGIQMMEQHQEVGHLVAPFLMLVQRVQPAVGVIENVPDYASTASACILRSFLRDMGYATHEVVLNSLDFGCLEQRLRWFMVFATRGVEIDLSGLTPALHAVPRVADILDPEVSPSRWSPMEGLRAKEVRDKAAGKGFAMQIVSPDATRVGTIGKGYAKNRSTEPKLQHPTDPRLLRLFTGDEHARIKGVDPRLVAGLADTTKHVILGQGIAYAPVVALARRIGECVKRSVASVTALTPATAGYRLDRAVG